MFTQPVEVASSTVRKNIAADAWVRRRAACVPRRWHWYDISMPVMYCPQCGRELDLDTGDVRFCRYCGFSLLDTKESLQGYSEQKRTGFAVVAWSYALLLIITLLLHGQYVSLDTRWGYWLPAILIVVSASLFTSAAFSASMPAMFSKATRSGKGTRESDETVLRAWAVEEVRLRRCRRRRVCRSRV